MLLAQPSDADPELERITIAVTGMMTRGGIDPKEVEGLQLVLAGALQKESRIRSIMPSEIETLLGLEAQKQLAGCQDEGSCLAEIGGALGAPYVLSTQVSKVGSTWILQLSLLDTASSQTLHRATRETKTLDELITAIKESVVETLAELPELGAAPGGASTASAEGELTSPAAETLTSRTHAVAAPNKSARVLFWVGLGAGALMTSLGGAGWAINEQKLQQHNKAVDSLRSTGATASSKPPTGLLTKAGAVTRTRARNNSALLALGGAILIAADATLGAVGSSKQSNQAGQSNQIGAKVMLVPVPGGAMATLGWRLP